MSSPRIQICSTHCSSTLAGVSYDSPSRLANKNKCHGRFPLVDVIMSTCFVSNDSTYWPIDGLSTNYIDFTIDSSNPHATMPPQATRTFSVYLKLRLTRQNSLHRCVPLVDAVTRMCLVSTDSASSLYQPEVERCVCCSNQLVQAPKTIRPYNIPCLSHFVLALKKI